MGGKEGTGAGAFGGVEVFNDGPGDGEAVVGAGAAPDFVEDDEAFGAGVVEDVGGLVHLDHEGGVPPGEFVTGTDAREDAIDKAEAATVGGDPCAALRHQDKEGDLPDISGFTRHIGAGDQRDLGVVGVGAVAVEVAVIRDKGVGAGETEAFLAHHLFDDGMAALLDFKGVGIVELGLAVAPFAGEATPAGKDVDFREGSRGFAEGVGLCEDCLDEFKEEGFFACEGFFIGLQDFAFAFLEDLGGETLGVLHGLPAGVVLRDALEVAFGDFDVVTESAGITDAEIFDPGAFLFLLLEFSEPLLAVAGEAAAMVELVVVAVADRAAFVDFGREFFGEGAFELLVEGGEIVDACRQCRDGGSGEFEEGGGDGGEGLEGFADPAQFAGAAQAVLESPENALEVADAPELGLDLGIKSLAGDKFCNALLTALYFREAALGCGEPAFEATGTGGGHGGVHRGEE